MFATFVRQALPSLLLATATVAGAQTPPAPPAAVAAAPRPLFLFLYRPGPAWVAGRPMIEQDLRPHGAYMRRLFDEGRLFAGGGFVGEDGGMAVVRADDLAGAQALLAADPAITSGVFTAEIRQWRPRFHGAGPLVEPAN